MFANISLYVAVLAAFLSVPSCQDYGIDSQPEAPLSLFTDARDSYSLTALRPDRIVFNISSNTPWSIESSEQWCVPTPAMSASSSLVSEITVNTEDNEGRLSRAAVLTITAEGVGEPVLITVFQASKENLVVVPYDSRIPTEGGDVSFTLVSNKPWEIIPSTAFLSDIDMVSGSGDEDGRVNTITVRVPANPGAVRSGELKVRTDFEEYVFTLTQNGVVMELAGSPDPHSLVLPEGGLPVEHVCEIRSNRPWKVSVPDEYAGWLSAEKISDTAMKISASMNDRLSQRRGEVLLESQEIIDGFDGIAIEVRQDPPFVFGPGVGAEVDESTGNVKVEFSKGEIFRSGFVVNKGRTVVELADMHVTALKKFGFCFISSGPLGSNYKFHAEADGNYRFRCGGGFAWSAALAKPFTLDEINALRRLEFVVEDDPSQAGKLSISVYLNGELCATHAGRDDAFENGEPGCRFIFEADSSEPVPGDYCVFRRIEYIPSV